MNECGEPGAVAIGRFHPGRAASSLAGVNSLQTRAPRCLLAVAIASATLTVHAGSAAAATCRAQLDVPQGMVGSTVVRNIRTRNVSCPAAYQAIHRAFYHRIAVPTSITASGRRFRCTNRPTGSADARIDHVTCRRGTVAQITWLSDYGI